MTETRNANWVYEKLTKENLDNYASRKDFSFKEDPSIPALFRSTLKDFRKSGFDRGHLAAAANHKDSLDAMADSFTLCNMSPQTPEFNRGYWAKLEKYVRDLTRNYETVEVFTGPLFISKVEDGKKWVTYQVIGDKDVAVPTHFYKVISLKKSDEKKLEAYILPNEPIAMNMSLDIFKTTLQKVESAAGISFFPD